MQYRRLGDAGMKVSTVSLGGWINFENKIPANEAEGIIRTAIDGGVNFFDLADVYAQGEAERWMGRMLADYSRQTLVISTKVFGRMSDDPNDRGLSRKHIMENIDKSLQRLGTDYVDIYFCHRYDDETPLYETARAMDDLIRQGKVLYWGTSEWSAEQLQSALDVCEAYNLYPPQVDQPEYSMLARERVEDEILPITEPNGVGLVVWSPLAYGMLTGKYDDGIPADSRFAREQWAAERKLTDTTREKVKALMPIAEELGINRAQLALAWVLRQPGVSSVITGATKIRQIEQNIEAADVQLSDNILEQIDVILNP